MMKNNYDVRTVQILNRDFVKCIKRKSGFDAWMLLAKKQKSYYAKAFVVSNRYGFHYLFSYQTLVAVYDTVNKVFYRVYNDYSVSTMNHINDFRLDYNLDIISKKEWLNIPVVTNDKTLFSNHCGGYDKETYIRLFDGTPYLI